MGQKHDNGIKPDLLFSTEQSELIDMIVRKYYETLEDGTDFRKAVREAFAEKKVYL